jgi:polypeptide N-acetylgalactosaminyltransferase
MSVYFSGIRFRGIWEWGFLYKETEIPEAESKKMKYVTEPYKSPTVSFMKKFLVSFRISF